MPSMFFKSREQEEKLNCAKNVSLPRQARRFFMTCIYRQVFGRIYHVHGKNKSDRGKVLTGNFFVLTRVKYDINKIDGPAESEFSSHCSKTRVGDHMRTHFLECRYLMVDVYSSSDVRSAKTRAQGLPSSRLL